MREPVRFQLSGPSGQVGVKGPLICYTELAEAETAVRAGEYGDFVVGAIPFDPESSNPSLYLGWQGGTPSFGASEVARTGDFLPDIGFNDAAISEYLRMIDHALPLLRSPDSALEKIVVARSERFFYNGFVDPVRLYERIAALYPRSHSYFVEHLETPGVYTMGASPELFLKKTGDRVSMTPLAGTVVRDQRISEAADKARARGELFTDKYLGEHRHLIDFMVKGLAPLCSDLEYPDEPELVPAPCLWHLGTPITGRLLDPDAGIAELVAALHPSPAVCGVPQEDARELIAGYEHARAYYGGLVGWLDSQGDCEFYMALRGFELDSQRSHLTLRAGGGVVAQSRIDTEFAETSAKLATMRRVLGLGG